MSWMRSPQFAHLSDDEVARRAEGAESRAREQFDEWRGLHEQMGFEFGPDYSGAVPRGKMRYQYGERSPELIRQNKTGTALHSLTKEPPEHVYRVEGPSGMQALRDTGELRSTFGGSEEGYTHVAAIPELKYSERGARVLRIENRARARHKFGDRGYGVIEGGVPASDIEDLGDVSDYDGPRYDPYAGYAGNVSVEDYEPPIPDEDSAIIGEQFSRDWERRRASVESDNPFDLL